MKWNKAIGVFLFAFTCAVIYIGVLYFNASHIRTIRDVETYEETQNGVWHIDLCEQVEDEIKITGWFFLNEISSSRPKMHIVLKNEHTNVFYQLKTSIVKRSDVTSAFGKLDGFYDNSGFYSIAKAERLPQGTYQLYMQYESDGAKVIQKLDYEFVLLR